ncbi:MAG: hypothetical protein KAG34_04745, partial [Cocleimonas sp.]|nr:hypothetical protein [Cocleimonas sp.]
IRFNIKREQLLILLSFMISTKITAPFQLCCLRNIFSVVNKKNIHLLILLLLLEQPYGLLMIDTGNKVKVTIDSLVNQARELEKELPVLGLSKIEFEGSDSLEAPDKVGKDG